MTLTFHIGTAITISLWLQGVCIGIHATRTESAFWKTVIKMLHGPLVHVGETVTYLQILGCELHQNASGGRAPPGPAGRAITLPQPPKRH